jgi:hypothetical protein
VVSNRDRNLLIGDFGALAFVSLMNASHTKEYSLPM